MEPMPSQSLEYEDDEIYKKLDFEMFIGNVNPTMVVI